MSGLPKGRRVSYAESFALDLSSKDTVSCDNVRVENKVLKSFGGSLTNMLTHGIKFLNLIGVNKDMLYLQQKQFIFKYNGEDAPYRIPMFGNLKGGSTDGHYVFSRDALYLTYDREGLWTYDTTIALHNINVFHTFFDRHFDDVAVVNDRAVLLFEENKILFADCDDRTFKSYDEADGAYFELPSRVQAIKSLGANTLYALGETCYKITFSADEEGIKAQAIARGLSRVFSHSVQVVGGKIIFATQDGLYALQGDKIKRIFRQIDGSALRFDNCYGSVWRGKYVLSAVYDGARTAYVLDTDEQACCAITHKDVKSICVYNENDFVLLNGDFSRIESESFADSRFVRRGIDFGVSARKYLRRLVICSKYDVDVYVTVDGVKRRYGIKGGDSVQSVPLSGCGRVFDVEISAQQRQLEVSRFELLADTYKEDNYGN